MYEVFKEPMLSCVLLTKRQNIFIASQGPDWEVKIGDFGKVYEH